MQTQPNTVVSPRKVQVQADANRPSERALTAPKAPTPVDTSGWLTRNESTDLLRCSVQTLRNLEQRGKLHPVYAMRPDALGTVRLTIVYNPKELATLPRYEQPNTIRQVGEVSARAFEMFNEGKALREIVIELRETPDRVDELRERWLDGGGSAVVLTPNGKLAFEQVVGPFGDLVELLNLVKKLRLGGDDADLAVSFEAKETIEAAIGTFSSIAELVEIVRGLHAEFAVKLSQTPP